MFSPHAKPPPRANRRPAPALPQMCSRQPLLQSLAQMRRLLDQRVMQRARELGKLLRRPVEHIAREQSASRDRVRSRRFAPANRARATSPRTAAPAAAQTRHERRSRCRSLRLCRTARAAASSSRARARTDTAPCSARTEWARRGESRPRCARAGAIPAQLWDRVHSLPSRSIC